MTLADGRDIALIYFIIIAFIVTLIPVVILGGSAYGLRILKRKLIPYFHLVQQYARRTADKTDHYATLLVRPVISASRASGQAEQRVQHIFQSLMEKINWKETHQK